MRSPARAVLEFLDVPASATWDLTPQEALDFLLAKGLDPSFDYRDLIGAEHARAFTVAKMMDTDLLADVKASLDEALAQGVPFQEWAAGITPLLQAKGWWGSQQVTDPLTGETVKAALGSPARLQTIYRTNMQSAYAAGAWDAIQANKHDAPYLLYDAVDDYRTRPEHHAWDGTVLPVADDWWATHYPPNGWNCRCSVVQLSAADLADLGLAPTAAPDDGTVAWTNPRTGKTRQVPKGIDPGWDYNVGAQRAKALAKALSDKVAGYAAQGHAFQTAAAHGLEAAAAAGKAVGDAGAHLLTAARNGKAAAMAAEERAAQAAIAQHLADNTPHLAKAIQALQASKSGQALSPAELLKAAEAKAAKAQQSAYLAHWKQSTLAGKVPGPKAQAAFDALPEDAQAALAAQVQAQAAEAAAAKAAAEAEALAQLKAQAEVEAMLAKSPGTLEAKAATKATQAAGADAKWTEVLAAAQQDIAEAKAKQLAGQVKAATKKAMVAGKQLTPAQAQFLGSLSETEMAALLAEVDQAQAANLAKLSMEADPVAPAGAQAVTAPAELDTSKLVQIGPQRGSNPGGLYQDPETGASWYIKTPPSAEHARNEVLAARLYQLAGADVPELRLVTLNGQPAVASRIVDGLVKVDGKALASTAGARDFFAVDAWLANWDVAGATFDNLLVKGGRAVRVDTGGALRFRAQGGLKGSAWGDTVGELDSLRAKGTNPQTAAVFGGMSRADLEASARQLLKIDRSKVDALVEEFGPLDPAERAALKATLRARLDNLADQLGLKVEAEAPAPLLQPGGKHVTAADFARITESRANGYTLSTDGGAIEDHQVLVQHYTDAAGVPRTRLVAKLRGEGAAAALAKLEPLAGRAEGLAADLGPFRDKALALAKSINSRAASGGVWDATINTRLRDFNVALTEVRDALSTAENAGNGNRAVVATRAAVDDVVREVRAWQNAHKEGQRIQAIAHLDLSKLADVKAAPRAAPADGALAWSRTRRFDYRIARFDRGHMIETTDSQALPAVHDVLEGEADGVRVRFIPDTDANSVSSRGLVHIDVAGADLAAAERAVATLGELGVTTTRTSQGERLGLYLDKLANLRGLKDAKLRTAWAKLDALPDEAARNAAKLAKLNELVGYDLTRSPYWNPDGVYQAFGHGRTLQLRPDLDTPAMAALERDTAVYTNVTGLGIGAGPDQWERLLSAIDGGGILSSQMERARRGIRGLGSSVSADHNSGGANYVFTRLVGKRQTAAGVYFKPSILRRIDAFSYDGDRFGSVAVETQRAHRAIDADGFAANRGNRSNETNFRDGISLFDDLERIIFSSQAEAKRAIADMRARGYRTWPDGRALEDVLLGPQK